MATSGADALPSGGHLNDNKGPVIVGITMGIVSLSTLVVAARLYVRASILRKFHLDDLFILFSLACAWMGVVFTNEAVKNGFGRRISTLTEEQLSNSIKWILASYVPGVLSFTVPKLAVVALLTRVFRLAAPRWHTYFLWIFTSAAVLFVTLSVTFVYITCDPPSSQWNFDVKGKCWDKWVMINFAIFASSFSASADIYLAVYPSFVLYNLRINRFKKIALSCALGIGSISAVVAIVKLTQLPTLAYPDFTHDTADLSIWTILEGCVIIIAASIPALQPLVLATTRKSFHSGSSTKRLRGPKSHKRDFSSRSIQFASNLDLPPACRYAPPVHQVAYPGEGELHLPGTQTYSSGPMTTGSWNNARKVSIVSRSDFVHEESRSQDRSGLASIHSRTADEPTVPTPPRGILRTDDIRISFEERHVNDVEIV